MLKKVIGKERNAMCLHDYLLYPTETNTIVTVVQVIDELIFLYIDHSHILQSTFKMSSIYHHVPIHVSFVALI